MCVGVLLLAWVCVGVHAEASIDPRMSSSIAFVPCLLRQGLLLSLKLTILARLPVPASPSSSLASVTHRAEAPGAYAALDFMWLPGVQAQVLMV